MMDSAEPRPKALTAADVLVETITNDSTVDAGFRLW